MSMGANWLYYAALPGHDCYVEVAKAIGTDRKTGRAIAAIQIRGVVFRGCVHEEGLFRRLERNSRLLPDSPGVAKSLCEAAEAVVQSLERDYGLTFLRGEEAWADRVKRFAV